MTQELLSQINHRDLLKRMAHNLIDQVASSHGERLTEEDLAKVNEQLSLLVAAATSAKNRVRSLKPTRTSA